MFDSVGVKVTKGHFRRLRELNRKRNYLFREYKYNIRILIAKLLWDARKRKPFVNSEIKSILIIRSEGTIGDQAVCYPLIKELYDKGFTVDILVTRSSACFMKHNPYIRDVYESGDMSRRDYLRSFNHAVAGNVVSELKKNNYDLIIDPSLDFPVHRLRLLNDINAKSVIGLNKWLSIKRYSLSIDFKDLNKHITESIMSLAEKLNIHRKKYIPYNILLPENTLYEVKEYLSQYPKKSVIVINIFTGSNERCFSQKQLFSLIDGINKSYRDIKIILLDHRGEIKTLLPGNVEINPFKTIHHMMALIHESDLIITPDTSVVHISAAWEKRLISVYKDIPENNNLWSPGYKNASQLIVDTRTLHEHDAIPEIILKEIHRLNLFENYKVST